MDSVSRTIRKNIPYARQRVPCKIRSKLKTSRQGRHEYLLYYSELDIAVGCLLGNALGGWLHSLSIESIRLQEIQSQESDALSV